VNKYFSTAGKIQLQEKKNTADKSVVAASSLQPLVPGRASEVL
jgi:hypothetical protein